MTGNEPQPFVLFVGSDLVFAEKVQSAAVANGLSARWKQNVGDAFAEAADPACRAVLLDLETPGLSVADFLARLPRQQRPRVIAYGAHVRAGRLKQAREAGCDEVVTRGRFSQDLPEILGKCIRKRADAAERGERAN